MKVIECLAASLLFAAAAAHAELPPKAMNARGAAAQQPVELEDPVAIYAERIAEELGRRIEVQVASRLAQYWARTDVTLEPEERFVARAD